MFFKWNFFGDFQVRPHLPGDPGRDDVLHPLLDHRNHDLRRHAGKRLQRDSQRDRLHIQVSPNKQYPHEIFAFRKLRILRVFFKIHGGLKMSKKRSKYRFRVPPQMRRTQKKLIFTFLTIFDKNTGRRVTKICPDYLISGTYKSYLIVFPVTPKKYF